MGTQQYANPLSGGISIPSVPMQQPQSQLGLGRGYTGHNRVRSMNSGPSSTKHQHYLSSSAVSGNVNNGRRRKRRGRGPKKASPMILANKGTNVGYVSGGSSNTSSQSIQSAPVSQGSTATTNQVQESQGGFLSSIGSTAWGYFVGGSNTETPGQ